jgi:YrbI family 3-deoxy-D-manno-octulosonate 8-phosphate phosphatase
MNDKKIFLKCKKIKLMINDVDGVLTDGCMYYSENGELLKKFNTRDGMGVELLRNASIKTIFLTGENSKITKKRAKKIGVDKCFLNIKHKESKLDEICKIFKIKYENIAYIGDDINDFKIMKLSNLSAAPNDAIPEIKSICNYICKTKGGYGAFREFADFILKHK